ncbi:MAG: Bug family tripartite tricarboxylate transporter substrate binding protein [Gallionellaceae bacterium]|nr:Bug family tripartite tricarboxylate transporter substrate binding protein [Gallionellaceae bacterium]
MINRRQFSISAVTATLTGLPTLGMAQTLSKPVKIIVGFPPGGSADLIARALSLQLGSYASSIIVDNKAGAGGRIALEALKNSEADGTTMVVTPASMMVVYPHIFKKLSYDPLVDFAPVITVASAQFVVAIGPMVPASVKNLADFLQWCRANPKEANYGSSGAGSIPHFTGVALSNASGIPLTHVAYKGAAPALNDLLGGQIAANVSVLSNALPHIQSGKLRALAVSGASRSATLPNIPTLAEAGIKDVQAIEWFGVFLPAKTPADIVTKLNTAVREALKSKSLLESLAKSSFDAGAGEAAADFARRVKADHTRWGGIVKASGFTPED